MGEVLGIVGGVAAAAEEGVEGEPVALAELFESFPALGIGGVSGSGGVDERPLGGIELAWYGGGGVRHGSSARSLQRG